jgi:hypothetical protein
MLGRGGARQDAATPEEARSGTSRSAAGRTGSARAIRAPFGAAFLGLALLGASTLVACAPKAEPAKTAFPFAVSATQDFALGPEGFLALAAGTSPAPSAGQPSSLALRVAALSADASSKRIVAALNRFGVGVLETSPDGRNYRLLNTALADFAVQSVAGLWPRGPGSAAREDAFLLELFRDPFVEGSLARNDENPELLTLSAKGEAQRLPRLGEPGEDLFALFPGPGGRWYAELRTEKVLGAKLRYVSLAAPEEKSGSRELSRELFETSLAPRPLALAPTSLRTALAFLGAGPFLVHARDQNGGEGFWLTGGKAEEASEIFAWLGAGEEACVVLDPSGRGAFVAPGGVGGARDFSLKAPLSGARFSTLAALLPPSSEAGVGLVAAGWEDGVFPMVTASGLVVAPLPRVSP